MADIKDLRYIVFLIDSRSKIHDGRVFLNIQDAKEFAQDYAEDGLYEKAIIGMFVLDGSEHQNISKIETFGFKSDKKKVEQLDLFKPYTPH